MTRKLALDIYRLAWPVLIAQLAVMAYSVIDTIMAGRYATDDLAAVGIGASIYISVFVALMGVLLAVSPIVGQLHGAGGHAAIGEQVRQAMWLTAALAMLSFVVFRYPEPFLALSKPAPIVADKVRSYLAVAAWGAPAGLGFRLFSAYTTAVSLPRIMMALTLAGLAIKVPLNWIFVFGNFGSPPMGATGCALSTALVNWVTCALAWTWCAVSDDYRRHAVFAHWSWPRIADQRHLLALGIPIGMTFLVDVTAFTFMALFVARLGAVNSAAHQIASNVAAVMFMVPLALSNGVVALVAQAIGAGKWPVARSTAITGIVLGVIVAAITGATLALGAAAVASFYTADSVVAAIATALLVLVAMYHVFDALAVVTVTALRGYKRAVMPLFFNAVGLWGVGLAGGYVLALTDMLPVSLFGAATPLGVRGFWIAAIAGMLVSACATVVYFLWVSSPRSRVELRGSDRKEIA